MISMIQRLGKRFVGVCILFWCQVCRKKWLDMNNMMWARKVENKIKTKERKINAFEMILSKWVEIFQWKFISEWKWTGGWTAWIKSIWIFVRNSWEYDITKYVPFSGCYFFLKWKCKMSLFRRASFQISIDLGGNQNSSIKALYLCEGALLCHNISLFELKIIFQVPFFNETT